jgi:hypothetical protein
MTALFLYSKMLNLMLNKSVTLLMSFTKSHLNRIPISSCFITSSLILFVGINIE